MMKHQNLLSYIEINEDEHQTFRFIVHGCNHADGLYNEYDIGKYPEMS